MVMERMLRGLIAAALLISVHPRAVAVQENSPPSQAQVAAARDINALVRQVLADRIPAKDIPDFGLLRGEKRIAGRRSKDGGGLRDTDAAGPSFNGSNAKLKRRSPENGSCNLSSAPPGAPNSALVIGGGCPP